MHLHPDSDHLIAKFERSEFRYFLNLAPINFNQVVGLYIATLLIVWQVISFTFGRIWCNKAQMPLTRALDL